MNDNRRGVLIAVVSMVAILVVGLVGYNVLAGGRAPSASAAMEEKVDAGETSGAASGAQASEQDSGQGTAAQDTQKDAQDVPMLADYDATVYTDANEPMTLTQIADGKPLVMNFWATWCPYCVQEMPDFQQLYEEYGDRVSFAFIDATDGSRETLDAARSWLADNGLTDLPAYYDLDLNATAMFAARALPTTVVVSADGRILGVRSGMIDPSQMRATLDSLV